MHFMNYSEISQARTQHRNHPVLKPATEILHDLMELANENSDGWAYWPKPARAADKLMTLIENPETATVDNLKKALRPVKSFLTRQGFTLDMKGY